MTMNYKKVNENSMNLLEEAVGKSRGIIRTSERLHSGLKVVVWVKKESVEKMENTNPVLPVRLVRNADCVERAQKRLLGIN